ncbi:MAG: cupin domain-containing protein [Verrucomicrobiota bacterium]
MRKINIDEVEEDQWGSPSGKFEGFGKSVSIALGRDPESMDLVKRHPFDVEILRIPPGKKPYPYHSHSAQWEFYHIISGKGRVRDENDEPVPIGSGDAFVFKPGEAHQLINDGDEDLVVYVVADNPVGECYYYPDSRKWGLRHPEGRFFRGDSLDYYDGED